MCEFANTALLLYVLVKYTSCDIKIVQVKPCTHCQSIIEYYTGKVLYVGYECMCRYCELT